MDDLNNCAKSESIHTINKDSIELEQNKNTKPKIMQPESESAEDIVADLIKKATIVTDASSDEEEYLSAEEEDDEIENAYVVKSMVDNSVGSANNGEHGQKDCEENEEVEEEQEDDNDDDDEQDESEEENGNEEDPEEIVVDEMEERRKEEESLTEEQRLERKEKGQSLKDVGNAAFRNGSYPDAIEQYTKALEISPLNYHKDRAILFANRAACKMKEDKYEAAIKDSTHAIDLHPQYLKAVLRRAELYEKTEKLDEALKDYEAVVQLDPSHHPSRMACHRLQEQIKDRNEKMKTEMMGKLKDLGNMVLKPFGLSTNNFQLQQDPNTGSYSVQFQQGAKGNGS